MQKATSRAGEVVARYGGEEFILILPGASRVSAMRTANRLKELVEREAIPHESSGVSDVITVSQGLITVRLETDLSPGELVQKADKALYQAKEGGRNAIVVGEMEERRFIEP